MCVRLVSSLVVCMVVIAVTDTVSMAVQFVATLISLYFVAVSPQAAYASACRATLRSNLPTAPMERARAIPHYVQLVGAIAGERFYYP